MVFIRMHPKLPSVFVSRSMSYESRSMRDVVGQEEAGDIFRGPRWNRGCQQEEGQETDTSRSEEEKVEEQLV